MMILVDEDSIKTLMKNIAVWTAYQGYNIAMNHIFSSKKISEDKVRDFLKSDDLFSGLDDEVIDFIANVLKDMDK